MGRSMVIKNQFVRLSVSLGNTKLGNIPQFNLPPGMTCSKEACKTCLVCGCYAVKAWKQYKDVRYAWYCNYMGLTHYPHEVEKALFSFFSRNRRKPLQFFRIHSSGDFFAAWYLLMWCRIAAAFPDIRFLAFTKQFDVLRSVGRDRIPENMIVYLSGWEGLTVPEDLRKLYPVADCVPEGMPAPENSTECAGDCRNCKHCFISGKNTYFHKH